jgi:putative flippase GtrA
LTNYGLSVRWVFVNRNIKNIWAEILFFTIIGVVGLAINAMIMWILTEYVFINYLISKLASTVVVFLWNFTGRKIILFR